MKLATALLFSFPLIMSYSCGDSNSATDKPMTENEPKDSTELTTETNEPTSSTIALKEKKDKSDSRPDSPVKQIYKAGIDGVQNSGVLETAKKVGDKAPNFSLKNAVGKTISLADYLKDGPVIVTWYRGGWCPYCNIALHYLQDELPNFKSLGANLIAISPEIPDESISTKEKNELAFEVLSDNGNAVAKKFGVVYKMTKELAEVYNEKFELNEHNGDTSNELPIAATYIIDTDGTIVYAFVDYDYRNRAEPKDLTKFLQTMAKK